MTLINRAPPVKTMPPRAIPQRSRPGSFRVQDYGPAPGSIREVDPEQHDGTPARLSNSQGLSEEKPGNRCGHHRNAVDKHRRPRRGQPDRRAIGTEKSAHAGEESKADEGCVQAKDIIDREEEISRFLPMFPFRRTRFGGRGIRRSL